MIIEKGARMDKPPEDIPMIAQLLAAVTAIISALWAYITKNQRITRETIQDIQKQVSSIDKSNASNSVLVHETNKRVERIENKLDRIIDDKK